MMLINRSLPVAILPLVVIILMQITFISPSSPPPSFPAHRRTFGLVDRFVRVNPLRALSNYLGRKLSLNVYYPPPPRQQLQPQIVYVPGGIPPQQSTHYVKLPVYLGQNVALIPPVNPASQFNIVSQPNYQQVQQPPQPQQYFLHGISYPVSAPPPSQHFIQQPQQTYVQPAVSNYQPPVVTQATSVQQVQPQFQQSQVPTTYVPQTSILVDEQHKVQQGDVQYPYSLGSNIQAQSSPSQAVDNSFGTLPAIVNSAFQINENDPSLNPHGSHPNIEIDGFEDASSSGDMVKIFVIRPKDMERLKGATESERNELAKEYSMKYFDLEQGAQELSLDSGDQRDQVKNSQDDSDGQKDDSCIEPLCDSFLQKLIPQLLESARNGKEDDDPIVIIKNNSHITTFNEDPFLQNHRLVDLEVSQSQERNNDNNEPQYTVMKAVDGVEGHTTEEIFEGQHSTLKPKRVKVHFPRKKLISAKITSAALRRKQSQSGSVSTGDSNEANTSTQNFSRNTLSLIPKPRNLQIDEVTYPRYKYRTARSRNLGKQRTARAGQLNERKDNIKGKTLIHYAGGVIFNNDSKVSK